VQAYGAAAIGYFSNLPLTYLGGLVLGVAAALSTKYISDVSWLANVPASLPFIVLFVALLVTPRAKLALRRPPPPPPPRVAYTAPARVSIPGAVIVIVLLAFVPDLVGTKLAAWTLGVMYIVLFLSLGLLVRTSGMVSLCQLAFAAVGAATYGNLVTDHGVPWLFALVAAGLVTIPVGLIIAIPAIRLSGVFLALATLGFGIMLEHMFYTQDILFGPLADGIKSPRPGFASSDHDYYLLVLAVAVVCSIAVVAIVRGRLGRLLRALADSPLALDTQGATTNVTRALVFGISAFFAGIFGALMAGFFGSISGTSFPSFQSLTIIAVVVLAVGGAPWYAVMAAIFFQVLPSYFADWFGISDIASYVQIAFGLGAVVFVGSVAKRPPEVPVGLQHFLDRLGGRRRDEAVAHATDASVAPPADAVVPRAEEHTGLEVAEVTVRFGGLVAVDHLSLQAPTGRITGLIGPNGAGKTTTFNACSGILRPNEGRVILHGRNVTRLGAAARARRGLGRTFQRAELWPSLSVEENVALGLEASMAGGGVVSQVVSKPGDRKRIASAVDRALELTGIGHLRDRQVALITTGEKRLVELARCLAGPFDVLLLDEPSSGLDATETEQFGRVLRHVVAEQGAGLLLVEHDMALVMEVCEHIYVMDFGKMIFEGSPAEVRTSPLVQAAYLGTEADEELASMAETAGVLPDPAAT
jgi:ABC-type branched-subunit amino acid transport system ATPase component/ABC-type branched-subunit amino acid transport system permease subunit